MEPIQNEKGEWVIPASKRPDGTWRKEKVLKEGYVPQDEVRAFETRASKSASVKKGIPGMPPPVAKPAPQPKSEARKVEKKAEKVDTAKLTSSIAGMSVGAAPVADATKAAEAVPDQKDPAKRVKALKKKLREIEELAGKALGELSKEQIDKLSKKESIEAEIIALETK